MAEQGNERLSLGDVEYPQGTVPRAGAQGRIVPHAILLDRRGTDLQPRICE